MQEISKYNLSSEGRIGKALVINIGRFKDDKKGIKTRKGSEIDIENLERVFHHLKFGITIKRDLTKEKITEALNEFVSELNEVSICCVCVMSHGKNGNILSFDNEEVIPEKDILEQFSNENCPEMLGKPKMFLFQFCRAEKIQRDASQGELPETRFYSALRDAIIAYSTVPDFVSHRDTIDGTWFTKAFCEIFLASDTDTEVQRLFKLVSQKLSGMTDAREKQTMEVTYRSFEKDLFFRTCEYTCSFPLESNSTNNVLHDSEQGKEHSLFCLIWHIMGKILYWPVWLVSWLYKSCIPACEVCRSNPYPNTSTPCEEKMQLISQNPEANIEEISSSRPTAIDTLFAKRKAKEVALVDYNKAIQRYNRSNIEDLKSREVAVIQLNNTWENLKEAWRDLLEAKHDLGSLIQDIKQQSFIDLQYEHENIIMNSNTIKND